jgi:hypothetical protein
MKQNLLGIILTFLIQIEDVRFDVIIVVTTKITVFWGPLFYSAAKSSRFL